MQRFCVDETHKQEVFQEGNWTNTNGCITCSFCTRGFGLQCVCVCVGGNSGSTLQWGLKFQLHLGHYFLSAIPSPSQDAYSLLILLVMLMRFPWSRLNFALSATNRWGGEEMNSYKVTLTTDLSQVELPITLYNLLQLQFLKIVNKDNIYLMKATVTLSILPSTWYL